MSHSPSTKLCVASSGFSAQDENLFHERMVDGRQSEAINMLGDAAVFERWTDRPGRTLAARVLSFQGENRLAELRHIRNFRQYSDDPVAIFWGSFTVRGNFGPLADLDMLSERLEKAKGLSREDSEFSGVWARLASVHSTFRDFTAAYEALDIAAELSPEDMWIQIQRSSVLLNEDRTEESFELALDAMERTPNYWPVIAAVADRYWTANRDEEAFDLLLDALKRNESPGVARKLTNFYDETGAFEEALAMLTEFEKRSTRMDKSEVQWLAGYRASLLYQLGRGDEMVPEAEKADYHFYKEIAKRVETGEFEKGRRVRLNVPFVRQNELTCAPATLTALSLFFGREADHLEVAEEICYAGTPDFKERSWANEQGWIVREFRADWDTTVKLIDAGIPFAVATVEPTSAHLQAITGYDSRASTLIIRDPGDRHYRETLAGPFFEDYAHCGPRAMLLVPEEKTVALESIELPDEAEYDLVYEINTALEEHDRAAASSILAKLEESSPGHRLVDHAKLTLSSYDSDPTSGLKIARQIAERFPDSTRCEYALYTREVAQFNREEHLDYLRMKLKSDSVFTLYYKEIAEVLADDDRSLSEARYYYRRALKFRRTDPEVYYGLAGVHWSERNYERATKLYRISSCLDERDEGNAESFFKACRWVGKTTEGLAMLHERFDRLSFGSGIPALTLCDALSALNHDTEIPGILEKALQRSPSDGSLIYYAAKYFARIRESKRAHELVEQARGRISEASRQRLLARIAILESRPEDALSHWQSVLEMEPIAMDAHRAVANLLSTTTDSVELSIKHLQKATMDFPHHVGLRETLISWLRDESPGAAEIELRELLSRNPANAWAWRELGLELEEQQRYDEALEAVEEAIRLKPGETWGYSVQGSILEEQRKLSDARASYRKALNLDVENGVAMSGLVRVSDGSEAKREALLFIESLLKTQVLFGDAFHPFRDLAFSILEPEELLEALRRAKEARPDLWETWSVLIDQHVDMGNFEEAISTAVELAEKFPTLPRVWLDLSGTYRISGDSDREIEALEKCLELNPQWTLPLRRLADCLENRGEFDEALSLLKRAVEESPKGTSELGCLADLQWKMSKRDAAFDTILRAVRTDSEYTWGWDSLATWGKVLERKEEVIAEGQRLTETVPLRAISWKRLANVYESFGQTDECFETLDEGLGKIPHSESLRDYKAWVLCEKGRFEAASAECREDLWPDDLRPRSLAAREAWIENERGNRDQAIKLMEVVAEEHSDFFWAHEMLSDWYVDEEKWQDAEKQARHLVRLRPNDCVPHGTLANIFMKQGLDESARTAFDQAFKLSPSYIFAGYHLTRLNLESGKLDEAEESLSTMEHHHPELASFAELRCFLELDRKDRKKAEEAFGRLCLLPDIAGPLLVRVEEKFTAKRYQARLITLYHDALTSGEVRSPSVARRWVNLCIDKFNSKKISAYLEAYPLRADVLENAWHEFTIELSEREQHRRASLLIRKNEDLFKKYSILWGAAGYVFRRAGKENATIEWMADWQEREDVEPWMLINLALSKLSVNGIGQSGPVHLHAVFQLPEDRDTFTHRACGAYFEIWRGNQEASRELLSRAEYGVLAPFYRMIYKLVEFRLSDENEEGNSGEIFREALKEFPEWNGNANGRSYVLNTMKECRKTLFFRPGVRGFAILNLLKGLCASEL